MDVHEHDPLRARLPARLHRPPARGARALLLRAGVVRIDRGSERDLRHPPGRADRRGRRRPDRGRGRRVRRGARHPPELDPRGCAGCHAHLDHRRSDRRSRRRRRHHRRLRDRVRAPAGHLGAGPGQPHRARGPVRARMPRGRREQRRRAREPRRRHHRPGVPVRRQPGAPQRGRLGGVPGQRRSPRRDGQSVRGQRRDHVRRRHLCRQPRHGAHHPLAVRSQQLVGGRVGRCGAGGPRRDVRRERGQRRQRHRRGGDHLGRRAGWRSRGTCSWRTTRGSRRAEASR